MLKSGQVIQSVCAWNQKPSCSTALRGQYEVHVVNSMKGRSLFFFENFKSLNYFSRVLEIYVSRKIYMRSKLLNQVNILVGIQSSRSWIISLAHEKSLYNIAWFFFFFFFFFLSWDFQNFAALFISFLIFMTDFWLNIGKKIFYLIVLKLKVSSFTTDWIYHQ